MRTGYTNTGGAGGGYTPPQLMVSPHLSHQIIMNDGLYGNDNDIIPL